ncbi:MAG: hypothetical protein ACLFM7_05575 [Bacteroidales bacterium]
MALYLKLLLLVIIMVAIIMGVFGLKLLYDKGARFNVESDPDKYKKIKKDGIYSAYSEKNNRAQDSDKDT